MPANAIKTNALEGVGDLLNPRENRSDSENNCTINLTAFKFLTTSICFVHLPRKRRPKTICNRLPMANLIKAGIKL